MVWAIYKEGTLEVKRRFQIIYDVELDAKGEPSYTWVDLLSNDKGEEFFDTAVEAQHDYENQFGDGLEEMRGLGLDV